MGCFGNEPTSKPKKQLNKSKIFKFIIILLFILLITTLFIAYKVNDNIRNFVDIYIFRKIINEDDVLYIEIDTSCKENFFIKKFIKKIKRTSFYF